MTVNGMCTVSHSHCIRASAPLRLNCFVLFLAKHSFIMVQRMHNDILASYFRMITYVYMHTVYLYLDHVENDHVLHDFI